MAASNDTPQSRRTILRWLAYTAAMVAAAFLGGCHSKRESPKEIPAKRMPPRPR